MPRTNRNTLKEYFKRGSMPNQKHFYELIDSMVNISDDGIDKNPDDGLRLAPSKENSPVISLFTNIQDNIPEWKIYLGNNSQLHIIRQGQDEPILSLHPNGRIEMNQPGMDIRINGSLSATRFDGAIRGKFPADGEWHTLQIPTEGCRAYRIMAGCGKLKSGQYALVEPRLSIVTENIEKSVRINPGSVPFLTRSNSVGTAPDKNASCKYVADGIMETTSLFVSR